MKAVVQRVHNAQVVVDDASIGRIGEGLLVYLGVTRTDAEGDVRYIAEKLAGLRIFADDAGKMNRSVSDIEGGILLISNFTLCGDCRRGRRPSFDDAARPEQAEPLYEAVAAALKRQGLPVAQGRFGALMQVESVNDGPVTLWLDSAQA